MTYGKRFQGRGVGKTRPPYNIEKKRGREKIEGGKSVVGKGGGGGRCLCCLQPLNITVVQNIFHHGDSLMSHYDHPNTPLTLSSSTVTIQRVCQRLITHPGLIHQHMCLYPNDFPHTAQKSIPVCPKPDWIFYQPNSLIIHRIGFLFKNDNLHLYMNEF